MANSLSDNTSNVYISYGFAEGRIHGKTMQKRLVNLGYKITINPKNADIIIAHSAGCWEIPPECTPKLVIYVGMPLPISKAQLVWIKANYHSMLSGIKRGSIIKLIRNTFYNIILYFCRF